MTRKMKNNIAGWLYVLPSFLLLITFFIIPICRSFYYSLTDYSVLSSPVFCGFKNYITALKDSFVQASLKNTCIYVLVYGSDADDSFHDHCGSDRNEIPEQVWSFCKGLPVHSGYFFICPCRNAVYAAGLRQTAVS